MTHPELMNWEMDTVVIIQPPELSFRNITVAISMGPKIISHVVRYYLQET